MAPLPMRTYVRWRWPGQPPVYGEVGSWLSQVNGHLPINCDDGTYRIVRRADVTVLLLGTDPLLQTSAMRMGLDA